MKDKYIIVFFLFLDFNVCYTTNMRIRMQYNLEQLGFGKARLGFTNIYYKNIHDLYHIWN